MQFSTKKTSAQEIASIHAKFRTWQTAAVLSMTAGIAAMGYAFGTPGDQFIWTVVGVVLIGFGVRSTVTASALRTLHVVAEQIDRKLDR